MRAKPYPEVLPTIDPQWKTADVMGLARGIHKERAFDRLPLLMDALMDAGCTDEVIFTHLRGVKHQCPRCEGKKGWKPYDSDMLWWQDCNYCSATGFTYVDSLHRRYWGNSEPTGCWERECWLVNHILGEEQPLRALIRSNPHYLEGREATVVNPGDWFGTTWLVYSDGCWDPPLFIVEAEHASAAEEEYIDSQWGVNDRLGEQDLEDYRAGEDYTCAFSPGGHPYDSESITVVGDDSRPRRTPYHCRYIGPGLPAKGVRPVAYYDRYTCQVCGKMVYPLAMHDRVSRNSTFVIDEVCSQACREKLTGETIELPELTDVS